MASAPCLSLQLLLEKFVDGECASDESLRVREHLAGCPACRAGLRTITDFKRRIAHASPPPVPADLEPRIRRALRSSGRRLRPWMALAAAAGLVAAVILLLPSVPDGTPAWVTAGVAAHESYLSGAARRETKEIADDSVFEGGSGLIRRGGTPISLFPADADRLPDSQRRVRAGRAYHVFKAGSTTALVCRAGAGAHLWIARLPEEELAACAFDRPAKLEVFSGERLAIRGIACRACCARAEACAKKIDGIADAKVSLEAMEIRVTGPRRPDRATLVRRLKEAGLDVFAN